MGAGWVSGYGVSKRKGETMATYTVTVRCQHCSATYMLTKWSEVSVGTLTTPNAGQKCPGCQRESQPAVIVAVQKVG